MSPLAVFPGVEYAAVEGLRTEGGHERIVIAYRNERSLRELIAGPAILGFGFSSREQALVGSTACAAAVAAQRPAEKTAGRKIELQRLSLTELQAQALSAFRKVQKVLVTSCCDVFASISVMSSSSNSVSVAIRMALGSVV